MGTGTTRSWSIGIAALGLLAASSLLGVPATPAAGQVPAASPPITLPDGVPAKVADVLAFIDEHGTAPRGFVGGRSFDNDGRDDEQVLPQTDAQGGEIEYHEWDVNPRVLHKNRGAERLVTGSDGSAYYTSDHYKTFITLRGGPDAASGADGGPVDNAAVARSPARAPRPTGQSLPDIGQLPPEVAAKVHAVLAYIRVHDAPMPGYEGGRTFHNSGQGGGQVLPRVDADGHLIRYREWDVNPRVPGRNRGAERLVTGSDGSAYYTRDHYQTFLRIR